MENIDDVSMKKQLYQADTIRATDTVGSVSISAKCISLIHIDLERRWDIILEVYHITHHSGVLACYQA